MEEVITYKCGVCKHTYDSEIDALQCEFRHVRCTYANVLLDKGYELSSINYLCSFNWTLSKEQENITKDNCFIISHWQCCEKPAYQIQAITEYGDVYVHGKGGYGGSYGNDVGVSKLPKPYPKEDLYTYK